MSDFKDVIIGAKAKEELKKGVDTLANAVKVTLGPRGRHVAIQRNYGPPLITKDGVTVARSIVLKDAVQNMGAQLIKSVAAAANAAAGDGTTTATVLAQEIFERGHQAISSGHNPVLVKRGMDFAIKALVDELAAISIKISDEASIKSVATISANNDSALGSIIAEAVSAVGEYGFITVEEGTGGDTKVDYVDGITVDRGLLSTDFISNARTLSCDLDHVHILCYDDKIETINEMADLLKDVANTGKPLLIIAKDYTQDTISHILYNRIKNGLNWCLIKAPGFGDTRREMLKDICTITGAKFLSNDHGRKFQDVSLSDLGYAEKVSVGLNQTSIVGGAGGTEAIQERIEILESQLKNVEMHDYQAEAIKSRIAKMTGSAAIFKVGGASESEVREKKDRVEDAINAVRSALAEGIVPGGGAALIHALPALERLDTSKFIPEEIVGISIIAESIKAPLRQILINAGDERIFDETVDWIKSQGTLAGYDALRREYHQDMISHGVVDPVKVVRSALEQAASASGTLLTTEATISDIEE